MDQEAAFFKVLSEPIRLRLMILLAIKGRTCVCQLAEALDEPEYKVSRHQICYLIPGEQILPVLQFQ